jgi:hypothetical protein
VAELRAAARRGVGTAGVRPGDAGRLADIVDTYDPHGVLQAGSYTRA